MFISERRLLLRVGSGMLSALSLVACADLFGFDPSTSPESRDDGASGRGGAAVAGNHASGGKAGDVSSGGGAGVARGGRGGSSPEQGGGGGAGRSGGGGDAGMSGEAGAGAGGADGERKWPVEGEPCAVKDQSECPGPAATYRLDCDGENWVRGDGCDGDSRCDRRTGACAPTLCNPEATTPTVTCFSEHRARYCGPDFVTYEYEDCAFLCSGAGCVEPGDNQVYVDRPRIIHAARQSWPHGSIPVCLANPEAWQTGELQAVKDAFYGSWGRYVAVGLTGFGTCGAASDGLSLDIVDHCNVELARIPQTGYPGPTALLPVTFCRTYVDSARDRHVVEPALFEHAIVHVFGHVLGHEDEPFFPGVEASVMMQAIDLSRWDGVDFLNESTTYLGWSQDEYGMTPSGSLGSAMGQCLARRSGSAALVRETCDGSPERSFRSVNGQLEHLATGQCLRVTSGDAVGFGDCDGAERWQAQSVQWRSHEGLCMGVPQPPSSGALISEPCAPRGTASQTWNFEFPQPGRARIRLASDGRCVRWPNTWDEPSYAELGACDGMNDTFETSRGELRVGGRCLRSGQFVVGQFVPCSDSLRYGLSGPLVSQAGALTAQAGDQDALELRVTPWLGTPSPEQIFDFYF